MKYTNSKGEMMEISEMPNAYLMNAYSKHSKRLQLLEKKVSNTQFIMQYLSDLRVLVKALREEMDKRHLA